MQEYLQKYKNIQHSTGLNLQHQTSNLASLVAQTVKNLHLIKNFRCTQKQENMFHSKGGKINQ